ncbi:glycogenin-2 [Gracilinanus agilis]|uniref:glycogenin-2 n=1 Tax=Gracilinanus agilis TaxID=191870 RepID=UPI001CFF14CA|nr:glycogenin-2 [Gracilinanus agilis]
MAAISEHISDHITDQAFVTLATNDVYCQGALVLGHSLKNHRITRKLVILITPQVSSLLRSYQNTLAKLQPVHKDEQSSPEYFLEPSNESPVQFTSDSIPLHTLEVQPIHKDEPNSPECFLEPKKEPLVQFARDPVPLHSLEQPMHKEESNSPECFLEPNNEPSAQFTSDPVSLHSLEVDLAFSLTELSIKQKVKEPSAEEERRKWEEGRVDYMGKDAFARIQEKLDRFLQ